MRHKHVYIYTLPIFATFNFTCQTHGNIVGRKEAWTSSSYTISQVITQKIKLAKEGEIWYMLPCHLDCDCDSSKQLCKLSHSNYIYPPLTSHFTTNKSSFNVSIDQITLDKVHFQCDSWCNKSFNVNTLDGGWSGSLYGSSVNCQSYSVIRGYSDTGGRGVEYCQSYSDSGHYSITVRSVRVTLDSKADC